MSSVFPPSQVSPPIWPTSPLELEHPILLCSLQIAVKCSVRTSSLNLEANWMFQRNHLEKSVFAMSREQL